MPNNHWSRVQGLQMVLFNFFVTSSYVIVSIKLCLHHVWYETDAFEITYGVVLDFVIGSPATSSSSVLKREGEFLSTGDWNDININWQKYTSHLYMSDVAYQLIKTQSGAIPMLTLVTPVTWCIQTKSGVLSSFKIWKPVSTANKKQKIRPILKVLLDDFNFYFLYISLESPPKTSQKLLPSSCASNAEQSVVSSSRTADGIIQFFRDLHNFILSFSIVRSTIG